MITIGGRPAAAVYADALREKVPYTITHTDESFRILDAESGGAVQVYLIQGQDHMSETIPRPLIHARMHGNPFDEGRLSEICAAVHHLPWSLQVTTAIFEGAAWLDPKPIPPNATTA